MLPVFATFTVTPQVSIYFGQAARQKLMKRAARCGFAGREVGRNHFHQRRTEADNLALF